MNYINNALGKNFNFHSNLSIPNKTINSLSSYYKDILNSWCKYYSCTPKVSSLVFSQFLWYNSYIKIDKEVVCYKKIANKKINFVSDLFDENGEFKSWQKILNDLQLTQKSYFKWFQLIHAIPRPWKLAVLNDKGNCKNIYLNHHLIKNNQTYSKRAILFIYFSEKWTSSIPKIFLQHFPQFTSWMEEDLSFAM